MSKLTLDFWLNFPSSISFNSRFNTYFSYSYLDKWPANGLQISSFADSCLLLPTLGVNVTCSLQALPALHLILLTV